MIDIGIHKEDEMGNIITLKQRHGLRIVWGGKEFVIPRFFKSDGASVPRFFWRLVFPALDAVAIRAALAHDYIYRMQPQGWTREMADNMFYELLIADGMSAWRARLAWLGVRCFGIHAWKMKGGCAK